MSDWKECIEDAFEEVGLVATEEQIATVADWVEGLHDNWSTYKGYDCIGGGESLEVKRLKAQIEELEAEKNEIYDSFRKNVARRHNVDIDRVTIEGKEGDAYVRC